LAERGACNQILWTTTGIRKQDLEFPDYDLFDEINTCELGILLKRFQPGIVTASTILAQPIGVVMDIVQFKTLIQVAELGSLSKAAEPYPFAVGRLALISTFAIAV
jgi:hypothetical protein